MIVLIHTIDCYNNTYIGWQTTNIW